MRGILCNKYTLQTRCYKAFDTKCAFKAAGTFYFSDPAWRLPEVGDHARVPIRVVWEGTTSLNVVTGEPLRPARTTAFREVSDDI